MALRCVSTTPPSGSKKLGTEVKYSYNEIAQQLTGINRKLNERIKEIEQTEAESWAKARTRIVGRR